LFFRQFNRQFHRLKVFSLNSYKAQPIAPNLVSIQIHLSCAKRIEPAKAKAFVISQFIQNSSAASNQQNTHLSADCSILRQLLEKPVMVKCRTISATKSRAIAKSGNDWMSY
jgi:hypothetical protein